VGSNKADSRSRDEGMRWAPEEASAGRGINCQTQDLPRGFFPCPPSLISLFSRRAAPQEGCLEMEEGTANNRGVTLTCPGHSAHEIMSLRLGGSEYRPVGALSPADTRGGYRRTESSRSCGWTLRPSLSPSDRSSPISPRRPARQLQTPGHWSSGPRPRRSARPRPHSSAHGSRLSSNSRLSRTAH